MVFLETDGLDAIRRMRDYGYSGTILGVTTFGSEKLKQPWFQAGCDDYLTKPLNKHELVNAVLRHMAGLREAIEASPADDIGFQ